MADQKEDKEFGKKCAFSGKAISRTKRYYRNGKYYLNKASYKAHMEKLENEKADAAKAE
ncbi:MAG: hypothetical protein KC713_01860 [Candidatus Omnitrophica bacterium]|nr:hypothetical protein [Candidatus Omnitrophota bacterium]